MRGVPRERRASSAAAPSDDRHVQNPRRPTDDFLQIRLRVEIEPMHDAEARPQRRRQQPGARRGADQRELLQRHLDRSRARALPDHDVELVVLHRRIQHFLDRRRHPVDLVDEQHLLLAQARQNRREIARPLEHRARRRPHGHAELVSDHVRQRRLAEPRRAVQQHVIERLAPLARGRDRHLQIGADPLLADVVVQRPRTQSGLVLDVFVDLRGGDDAVGSVVLSHRTSVHRRIVDSQVVSSQSSSRQRLRLTTAMADSRRAPERLLQSLFERAGGRLNSSRRPPPARQAADDTPGSSAPRARRCAATRPPKRRARRRVPAEASAPILSFSSSADPLGRLLADAGNARSAGRRCPA